MTSATATPMSLASDRISAWLDSYRLGIKDALQAASAGGFRLVQPSAFDRDLDPATLSRTGRRHFAKYLSSLGLRADAIGAIFPGGGLADPARGEERIDRLRQTLELCADTGVTAAISSIGGLEDEKEAGFARQALHRAAELADRYDVRLSLLAPGADAGKLAEELSRVGSPLLCMGLDAAALPTGLDLHRFLTKGVGEIHLRDARRAGSRFEETEFGAGDVDLRRLLRAAQECEYGGGIAIRRDTALHPVDALRSGRQYVRSLLAETAME